ncbi:MAG: divalent-cation tolerance protein CutA [Euryarchaeota archaeon]|jgi:periplasmic divalent cation tolerance protein|nr:divalent-cation tolerance protein CutA [Euryarchaeota archaeon]MBT4406872.1 divalent-cation tolerance protein CutA [Euryarchaeota archaeon]
MMALVVFLVTFPNEGSAKTISHSVIDAGLAACILRSPVTSVFNWQGKMEEESEIMLLFKVPQESAEELRDHIEDIHPYDNPAILELEANAGQLYEDWAKKQTNPVFSAKANSNNKMGDTISQVSDIFGGQNPHVDVEESDMSEAESIAFIKELMEGMDELEEIEDLLADTGEEGESEVKEKRGWFSLGKK